MLVEQLGLGWNGDSNWSLQGLFIDATNKEAGISNKKSSRPHPSAWGLTEHHTKGFVDQIGPSCTVTCGQKSHQTRIWPGTAESVDTLDDLDLSGLSYTPLDTLDGLVLSGLSYTP